MEQSEVLTPEQQRVWDEAQANPIFEFSSGNQIEHDDDLGLADNPPRPEPEPEPKKPSLLQQLTAECLADPLGTDRLREILHLSANAAHEIREEARRIAQAPMREANERKLQIEHLGYQKRNREIELQHARESYAKEQANLARQDLRSMKTGLPIKADSSEVRRLESEIAKIDAEITRIRG